jgi:putative ABC transport system permease protein
VRDSKYSNLRQSVPPIAYVDMDQIPADDSSPHLLVRSTRPIAAVSDSIARAIAQMDPLIAVRYRTMDAVVETALSRERLMATLSGVFGGLAVLIAMVGLYGVMSYVVARRRIEIGVRMALGAEGGAVQRMVIAQAGWLVVAGLVIGAGLAVVGGRAAAALLFGVRPADPVSLAIALTSLSAVALAASWLPAHRAARLDPTSALRDE